MVLALDLDERKDRDCGYPELSTAIQMAIAKLKCAGMKHQMHLEEADNGL